MAGKQTRLSTYCHLTAVAVLIMLQTAAISGAPLLERNVRQSGPTLQLQQEKHIQLGLYVLKDVIDFNFPQLTEQESEVRLISPTCIYNDIVHKIFQLCT